MIVLEAYIAVLGLVMASVEVESELCTKYIAAYVNKWLSFLSTAKGRGHYLLFVGFLSLSIWDPRTRGWTELFNIGAGFYVLVLALLNYATGCRASAKLSAAASNIASEEDLRRRFEEADVAMHGALAPEDVVQLLSHLDPPTTLSENELRAAVLAMDSSRDGEIQVEEIVSWWAASSNAREKTAASKRASAEWTLATGGPKSLRFVSFCAGLFLSVGGFIGFWTELTSVSHEAGNRNVFLLHTVLDVYVVLGGLLVALLESRATVFGVNVTFEIARSARIINRVWGRGLFYQFLGFVALSQWRVQELTNILSGFVMLGIGVLNAVIGAYTASKLAQVGMTAEAAEAKFREHDANGDGVLDTTEFEAVVRSMGVTLSRHQLEAAFFEVDTDGSGKIDLVEFVVWTQGDVPQNAAEAVVQGSGAPDSRTPLLAAAGEDQV